MSKRKAASKPWALMSWDEKQKLEIDEVKNKGKRRNFNIKGDDMTHENIDLMEIDEAIWKLKS